ncbi:MAG: GFA family protein [Sulfuritalea sp.]|nr:GFA family protein [Sulfuritalea sp.]MDP1983570.1 GFA family protein [Sulfuritalea sp.]
MIEGGCLCGGVRYRYDGEIDEISICHCSQCRKAQGSAFAAVSPVAADRFTIIAGTDLLREYRSSPDKARVFCSRCGSPIYSAKDDLPEIRRLRLGTVDTPFVCTNAFHIFTDSKASWWNCDDGLPRFAQRRPPA